MSELKDSEGNLAVDFDKRDTDAGAAYAKIKAVYPLLCRTKETTAKCTVESLLEDLEVKLILGGVKTFATVRRLSSTTRCRGISTASRGLRCTTAGGRWLSGR